MRVIEKQRKIERPKGKWLRHVEASKGKKMETETG